MELKSSTKSHTLFIILIGKNLAEYFQTGGFFFCVTCVFISDCVFFFFCLNRIIEENNGKPPLTYTKLQAIAKTIGLPKRPIPAPTMDDMKGITITEKQNSVTELSDRVICKDVWTFI